MLLVLFNIVFGLNIFFVIIKKKSYILTMVSTLLAVYIYFYNHGSNDYERYTWIYHGELVSEIEKGFVILTNLGNRFNLSFQQFQGIIATLCLLVVLYVYHNFSNNFHYFFSYYFIYQYFADLNLLRNFLMRTFLIVAIYFLIKQKKIAYVLLILIASLFHRTALIYLPLVFIDIKKEISTKTIKIFAGVIITLCVFAFLLGNNWSWVMRIAARFLGDEPQKLAYYFTTKTHYGFLIYFALFGICLFAIFRTKNNQIPEYFSEKEELYRWVLYINCYCIISFPLIMLNNNFYRIYNNIFFLNLFYFASFLDGYNTTTLQYYSKLGQAFCAFYLYRLPFVQAFDQKFLILK